jgi:membrane protein
MSQIKIFLLLNLMPEIAGKIITVYMEEFSANARRLTTSAGRVLVLS